MYLGNLDIAYMFSKVTTITNVMYMYMVSLVVFSSESIVH